MGKKTERFYSLLGVQTPFDPQHRFTTSYILLPLPLFIWRSIISIYALVTLIITYVHSGASQFSFFTVLSYWGVWGWYTISAIHTFSFWLSLRKWKISNEKGRNSESEMRESGRKSSVPSRPDSAFGGEEKPFNTKQEWKPRSWLDNWFRPLQALHVLLWSTIATFPLIVTAVFWVILASGAFRTTYTSWSNISVHALNLGFGLLEVFVIGRGPMLPWWNMLLVVLLIASYLGVAYITYETQGFYTYDFLDPDHGPILAAYIVGIGAATAISFLIGQFFIFLREFLAAKIQGSGGWGSGKAVGVPDDAAIPTQRGPGPEGEGGRRNHVDGGNELRQRWPTTH